MLGRFFSLTLAVGVVPSFALGQTNCDCLPGTPPFPASNTSRAYVSIATEFKVRSDTGEEFSANSNAARSRRNTLAYATVSPGGFLACGDDTPYVSLAVDQLYNSEGVGLPFQYVYNAPVALQASGKFFTDRYEGQLDITNEAYQWERQDPSAECSYKWFYSQRVGAADINDFGSITFNAIENNYVLATAVTPTLSEEAGDSCSIVIPLQNAQAINLYYNLTLRRGTPIVRRLTGTARIVPNVGIATRGIFSQASPNCSTSTCPETSAIGSGCSIASGVGAVTREDQISTTPQTQVVVDYNVTVRALTTDRLGRLNYPGPASWSDRNAVEDADGQDVELTPETYDPVTDMNFDGTVDATDLQLFDATYCLIDLDESGSVDFGDFLAFFDAYDNNQPLADLSATDGVGFEDLLLFFNYYELGCDY